MAGVIKINDTSSWSGAGWMYDDVLKKMADRLPNEDMKLHDLLMRNRTDVSVGYCDLRKLNTTQFAKIIQAADAIYIRVTSAGPKAFDDPKFYPGYVKQFGKLLEMLKGDPRAEKLAS